MYLSKADKVKIFLLKLIAQYLIWIIVVSIIVIWWFFPELINSLGQILLFWGPAIVLIISFMVGAYKIKFKTTKDKNEGVYPYQITINSTDLYYVDLLIYLGCLLILMAAYIFNDREVTAIDLIQALIYFAFAHLVKNIFIKKILY